MTEAILIFILSLMGAFVLRVCGFGFGVFTMAWLPYLLPSYGEATTLSGILAMSGSIMVTVKNWKHIDWHKLTPILITFIVSSCASTVTAMQILIQSREAMDDAIAFIDEKHPSESELVEYIAQLCS